MLYLLITFVGNEARHNRFFKNVFETTLACSVRQVHETILSITRGDLEPLQHIK